jgi:cyclase
MNSMQSTIPAALLIVPFLLILCAVSGMGAQENANRLFTLKQVGPNVWAAIEPGGMSNAGVVIGDDGVLVIDTLVTADAVGNPGTEEAEQLLAEIRKLTPLPVKYVVNTHYHLDHVSGNGNFAGAGATLMAQTYVRGWIHSENLKLFGNDIKPQQKAFVEALPAPALVYDGGVDLYLGSRRIQIRSFPGHTGGDSVVIVPDAKTVFAGDLFWRNVLPNLMDATTKLWIETLDTLVETHSDFTVVPGHGDVGAISDVIAFREYLATLRNGVADAQARGESGDAVVQSVVPGLKAKFGEWGFFELLAAPNVRDVDRELTGTKRIPQWP